MHVRPVAYEEEAPPPLHRVVVQVLGRAPHRPGEERAETEAPDKHRPGPDDGHAVPIALVARDAPIHEHAVSAVGVYPALEDGERRPGDGREEDEQDGQEPLHGAVQLHLQGGISAANQLRASPSAQEDAEDQGRAYALDRELDEGALHAVALGPDQGHCVAEEAHRAEELVEVLRVLQVRGLDDAGHLVVVQEEVEGGGEPMIPQPPGPVVVPGVVVEHGHDGGEQDDGEDGHDVVPDRVGAAGPAPLPSPVVAVLASGAALSLQPARAALARPAPGAPEEAFARVDLHGILGRCPEALLQERNCGVLRCMLRHVAQLVGARGAGHPHHALGARVPRVHAAEESFRADAVLHAGRALEGRAEGRRAGVALREAGHRAVAPPRAPLAGLPARPRRGLAGLALLAGCGPPGPLELAGRAALARVGRAEGVREADGLAAGAAPLALLGLGVADAHERPVLGDQALPVHAGGAQGHPVLPWIHPVLEPLAGRLLVPGRVVLAVRGEPLHGVLYDVIAHLHVAQRLNQLRSAFAAATFQFLAHPLRDCALLDLRVVNTSLPQTCIVSGKEDPCSVHCRESRTGEKPVPDQFVLAW
mmetsp:Transcript_115386/g.337380  ORF Transcript_115386/g.337380 Transcript_115386/m.337380 type:complete len:591 (-) Transcript_115386:904-2676(-)